MKKASGKLFDWFIDIFIWTYEIFLYSLALPLLIGIILTFSEAFSEASIWFNNFPWIIRIPILIVVGVYLKYKLKSRYFTKGNRLYVGNLHLSNEELKELFSSYGKVKNVINYQEEGLALIEMASPEEAEKAKDTLKDINPSLFLVIV